MSGAAGGLLRGIETAAKYHKRSLAIHPAPSSGAFKNMCGIAGIWNLESSDATPTARVTAMLKAMRHRGPDGEGSLEWPAGAAGMVRLALVDLSPRGQQPLWSPDGKVAVLFNGEMYNYREHRERLTSKGYPFKSETDTEVVLALYLERDLDFVTELRGMFALAIFDFRERGLTANPKLVLARDPFGIKPLYLAQRGDTLCFASELRALLQARLASQRIDREALADYLTFGFVLQPRTMLEDVRMLERGTVRVYEPGRAAREHRYWMMPPAADTGDSFEDAAARVRHTLEESVRLHAVADAPVGAFLSGGIDSSMTVALMAQHNSRLRTYTLRLTDPAEDESQPAREFAARLGCVHTEVEVGDAEVRDLFPKFALTLDQPSSDGFNTWLVSHAAARHVKGVLSGLGGDEWFGGYPAVRRMKALGPLRQVAGRLAERAKPLTPRSLGELSSRAQARSSGLSTWAAAHHVFRDYEVESMIGRRPGSGADRLVATLGDRLGDSEPVDLGCQLDVWAYMGCQLLRDSDVTSMASSLELRVPLVDREIAAVARSTAAHYKVDEAARPPAKRVLIEAVKDLLPADLPLRPKRGFSLPYAGWLNGPLRPLAADVLASLRRRRLLLRVPDHLGVPQTWALVTLELWCQSLVNHAP